MCANRAAEVYRKPGMNRRILCTVLRLIGVFLGLCLLTIALGGIFDLVPASSNVSRSFSERLMANLLPLILGILLVLPQKFFLQGKRHLLLICGYVAAILVVLMLAVLAVVDYRTGSKHWLIVPTSLILLAIPISNALVLLHLKRHVD